MAHPTGAEGQPGVDPGDRCVVAGHHRNTQVGPVRLRRRSQERPMARGADDRPERLVDDADAVVVLEDGHLRVGGAADRRSCRARPSLIAAPVGFCAREVSTTARVPRASARSSAAGTGPSSSTAIGAGIQPVAVTRSKSAAQPGSSTRDPVAGPEGRRGALARSRRARRRSRSPAPRAPRQRRGASGPPRRARARQGAAP